MKRFSSHFGFGVAVVLMVAVGAFAAVNLRTLMQESEWVRHSQTIMQKLEETISLVKDAQTAERGYVITGNERYLEPYQKALAPVDGVSARLHELRQLTTDNPEQNRWLDALEPLIIAKLALVRRIIDLRRSAGFDAAQQLVVTHEGKNAMDEIRARIAEMQTAESAMLQRRSEAA